MFASNIILSTIEVLKERGYHTAMLGKWHLGHNPNKPCSPPDRGFDFFYGIPYSHEEGWPGPRYTLLLLMISTFKKKRGEGEG